MPPMLILLLVGLLCFLSGCEASLSSSDNNNNNVRELVEGSDELQPTLSPTSYPKVPVGLMDLKISLYHHVSSSNKQRLTSKTITTETTQAVLNALDNMLCEDTDFGVLRQVAGAGSFNYCQQEQQQETGSSSSSTSSGSRSMLLSPSEAFQILDKSASLDTHDNDNGAGEGDYFLQWMEWMVLYPVVRVGESYLQEAGKLQAGRDDEGRTPEEQRVFVREQAIGIMGAVANQAMNRRIRDGSLNIFIQKTNTNTNAAASSTSIRLISAVVNSEKEVFEPIFLQEQQQSVGGNGNGNGNGDEDDYYNDEDENNNLGRYPNPLDPDPFHPIRVAGMFLLVATLVVVTLLLRMAANRKKEREHDAEERVKKRGGLGTQEGLDYMLEVGRKEAAEGYNNNNNNNNNNRNSNSNNYATNNNNNNNNNKAAGAGAGAAALSSSSSPPSSPQKSTTESGNGISSPPKTPSSLLPQRKEEAEEDEEPTII